MISATLLKAVNKCVLFVQILINKRLALAPILQNLLKSFMSEDKTIISNPDQQGINTSDKYELQEWSKKYGVSFDQLKRVVKDAGSIAKDVEDFLKKRNKKSNCT